MKENTNVNTKIEINGELLQNFRHDMRMSDIEWQRFCKRYANNDASSVLWYLSQYYNIPIYGKHDRLQELLNEELQKARENV